MDKPKRYISLAISNQSTVKFNSLSYFDTAITIIVNQPSTIVHILLGFLPHIINSLIFYDHVSTNLQNDIHDINVKLQEQEFGTSLILIALFDEESNMLPVLFDILIVTIFSCTIVSDYVTITVLITIQYIVGNNHNTKEHHIILTNVKR